MGQCCIGIALGQTTNVWLGCDENKTKTVVARKELDC